MAKIQADYSALQNDFKRRCEEVLNKERKVIQLDTELANVTQSLALKTKEVINHEKEILQLSADLNTTKDNFRVTGDELKGKKDELESQKRALFEYVFLFSMIHDYSIIDFSI